MDSKFVKTFELVQDTPMWVFNPDDLGCGLRATEVKPKLDRYLIKTKGKENMPKVWFIGDTDALDYKMMIESYDKEEVSYEEKYINKNGQSVKRNLFPLFFANLDSNKDTKEAKTPKRLLLFHTIRITIFSKHDNLLTEINNANQQLKLLKKFKIFKNKK